MAERVDVCIVGSGFGGSISAWRLAELYRAAGVDPKRILVLERGRRYKHTDFRQSMDIDHLSNVYNLIQSHRRQRRAGRDRERRGRRLEPLPGGVAARAARDLRAPRPPPRRRRPTGACGRSRSRASTLDPYYARAEQGCACSRPTWNQVSKSGGLWAATLARRRATPATACRSRSTSAAASTPSGATPAASSARRTRVNTNYLASAERAGRARAAETARSSRSAARADAPATATWSAPR